MFDLLITGAVGGAVGGGITAWTILRSTHRNQPDDDLLAPDPFIETNARLNSEQWATEAGREGYAPFLAEKIKLADQLGRRQARRRRFSRGGWS
jgi:hypothetical protein